MEHSQILRFAFVYYLYSVAALTSDHFDIIKLFNKNNVKYVVIGGGALDLLGIRDSSNDIDLYVKPSKENSILVYKSLYEFGAPLNSMGIKPNTFTDSEDGKAQNFAIGNIEIISGIKEISVPFEAAWNMKDIITVKGIPINVLTPQGVAEMKREGGRAKDRLDLELLEQRGIKPRM